jgi:3-carboxy-cis,cis-muconate cycloisomerase
VFAEAASIFLAGAIGRPEAHSLLERMTKETVASHRNLAEVLPEAIKADPKLSGKLDIAQLEKLFDPVVAAGPARRLAERQLKDLQTGAAALNAAKPR